MKKIRTLIVEDSIFFRKLLITKLTEFPRIEVVGCAVNAFEAKNKVEELNPDVMTLDVEMPGMNGIEFLKKLLPARKLPVVLVSSLNLNVFEALSAGAVDFLRKPDMSGQGGIEGFFKELSRKIVAASIANMKAASVPRAPVLMANPPLTESPKLDSVIIALGASTGGTEATLEVLKRLPANTPGIVIVQHMPPGFTKMYADRVNGLCKMHVKEAQHGDNVTRGKVLIAPGDMQMKLIKMGTQYKVNCFTGEKVSGHCPSVDVLFDSAAAAGSSAIGIIMTGMGSDGAKGLLKMRQRGSFTIGQDEATSIVYGMPKIAKELGAVMVQASNTTIADVLQRQLNQIARS